MRRTMLIVVLGGLVSAWSPPATAHAALTAIAAPADDEDEYVRDVVGRAAAHVDAGRYDEALAVLDDAERDRPLPVFVYVRATIEERRGDCERAAELYRAFLEQDVPEADAEEARRGVLRCRPEPETEDAGSEGGTGQDDSSEDGTSTRPWSADPWGVGLVIGGVAGVGVGLGLFAQSRADERAARSATTLQQFEDSSRRAVVLNRAGIATLVIGSALLVGGAARYAIVGTRERRRVQATAAWKPGRVSVGMRWRF